MKTKLVSIICLCWNHENYINQCFNSIFEQTYKNLEIIFIDNNSTDNSYSLGKSLLEKSEIKHKTIKRDNNFGISNNLNLALEQCSGEYVMCLSTDDWLTIDSVEHKINFLDKNQEYAMVYTNGFYYYQDNNLIEDFIVKTPFQGDVFKELLKFNFVFAIGVLMRLKSVISVGKYNEKINIEDWYMWLKLSKNYKVGYLDKKLAYYRIHNSNSSSNNKKMMQNEKLLLQEYLDYPEAKQGMRAIKLRYILSSFSKFLNFLPFYKTLKNTLK